MIFWEGKNEILQLSTILTNGMDIEISILKEKYHLPVLIFCTIVDKTRHILCVCGEENPRPEAEKYFLKMAH